MSSPMIRRAAAGALASALLLGLPGGLVRAEPQRPVEESKGVKPAISREQALAAVKRYFAVPADVQLDVQLISWSRAPRWEIRIVGTDKWSDDFGFTLATVDAMTGQILAYSAYQPGRRLIPTGPLQAPQTVEAARQKAEGLVKALVPADQYALLQLQAEDRSEAEPPGPYGKGGLDDGRLHFTFMEVRGGAVVPFNWVSVSIDSASLEVVSYNVSLRTGIDYAPGPASLTADQALEQYKALEPRLVYVPVREFFPGKGSPAAMQLQYLFPGANRLLDAATGQWIGRDYEAEVLNAAEQLPAATGAPVTAAALPLGEEEALRIARTLMNPPEDADLRVSSEGMDEDLVSVHMQSESVFSSVMFDRKSGTVRYAWRDPGKGGKSMKDLEEDVRAGRERDPKQTANARAEAIRLVQTYFSQYADQIRMVTPDKQFEESGAPFDMFVFVRYAEGIPVLTDSISIAIDPDTLQWSYISASWNADLNLPSTAGIATPDEARTAFFAGVKAQLVYRMAGDEYEFLFGMPPKGDSPNQASLAYVLKDAPRAVDATSRKAVDENGEPMAENDNAMAAIRGHWAEGELRYLVSMGVLKADQLDPNGPVTRARAVHMVLVRRDWYNYGGEPRTKLPFADVPAKSEAYPYVAAAYREGWLKPLGGDAKQFQPDAPITRAEFVVWLSRALGLGDLARSGLKVDPAYTDLGSLGNEDQKAASFLRALGLLKPMEQFRGSDLLTQAEGAALTARAYNYLAAGRK